MMQPTPAPSSAPGSPRPQADEKEETTKTEETMLYPVPPHNAGSAPFHVLSGLFDRLAAERKPDRRRKLLAAWFNHWREEKGFDLYPVLRLILPQKDKERAVYGLKEKNLAKTYIKLIPLGMRDPDAIRLLNWKRPSQRDSSSGDFSAVLFDVVSKRSSVIEGTLTIDHLNELLDELAASMGKQDLQSKILQRIYNRSTPEEQRWIVRIILKDMNILVKETTVFAVFHPDAQDLYNTCSDLKKVIWELWDPERRLNSEDKEIHLFRAFAPMLCKRPTKKIEESVKEMGGSEFIVEEKLDGERMQLHKRGNEYYYCSRKGKDYTYLYGKHVGAGSLTPYIDKAFDERVEEIILDGEMLVWDPVSERNLPFGTLKTAALDRSKKELNPRPCFKVFDLLYLNGQCILHKSTNFRKKNMRNCMTEIQGRIEFVNEYKGKTAKDIRTKMDEVMANRGEGLVLKHPGSQYVLNGRNKDWIKVKPEYMDNMGETVDVLVVAGNYGSGKRGGGVSTLICAVYDDRHQNDDEPKYSTFVRIGSGLSFADYVWVRSLRWKTWDPKNPPDFLQTAKKTQEDKGDVYLEPEDSFILKVKAAEVVVSDQYHLGYTMRFPRALSIREDLSIADCMSATAVLDTLRAERKRKLESDTAVATKKKRKTTTKKVSVLPEYRGANLREVPVESYLFDGMHFMVSSDPKSRTGDKDKKELMKLIHAHGGKCVQIAREQPKLFVVYGGTTTPYDLKLLVNKGVHDIVTPAWIEDSVANGKLVPLSKKYFFHATARRQETAEYNEGADSDTTMDDGPVTAGPSAQASHSETEDDDSDSEDKAQVKEEQPEDPSLAEWFTISDDKKAPAPAANANDSETEPDSDNADVADEGEDHWDDEYVHVSLEGKEETKEEVKEEVPENLKAEEMEDVKMGEDAQAMEYDQEKIFRHLCFYLDSPANARKNEMPVKSKYENDINQSFAQIATMITENGGRIVGIDEPKLTHVVVDKRDDSRRVALMSRTSKPKRRHLIISEYVQACLDEATLLDEDEFAP
ncbi:ATP-dependent DNA ligase [Pleurotus eryngii]|uniref:DNA ligase n=1 Tax=Pleurotus eryngii TaxID=5323 RepID=A0A9P6A478_PLEER|nr:ATP-dependent DNA ligase [Pleurotus eryngii]